MIEELQESELEEFEATMQNITASYNVIGNLTSLNDEKLKHLMAIYNQMIDHFSSFKCPPGNPMCNEKQKVQDFYDDFGMVISNILALNQDSKPLND